MSGPPAAAWRTSVGAQAIAAASGAVLVAFVVLHAGAGLVAHAGPRPMNDLVAWSHGPWLRWSLRAALLGAAVVHVAASARLSARNRDARRTPYRKRRPASTYAGRTMAWTGPLVLLFVVYHVAHVTFGATSGYAFDPHHSYNNLARGLSRWLVAVAYAGGAIALGLHLYHGVFAMGASLGRRGDPRTRRVAAGALAALVTAGFLSLPVAALAGRLPPSDERFCYEQLARRPGECAP